MVPASPVGGTAVSPSATINPVTTLVNDAACSSSPAPSVTFARGHEFNGDGDGRHHRHMCIDLKRAVPPFATAVSFNPVIAGTDAYR